MNNDRQYILEKQKQTWNTFSAGWKKWDRFNMAFLKPVGDEMIRALSPAKGDQILDIAGGTGEPGITMAGMIGDGKVIATDISSGMMEVARENAHKKAVSNYSIQYGDACNLPFAAEQFDKLSCRMGLMFFPNLQLAADEMIRVLKAGGKLSVSVWAEAAHNPWITAMMGTLSRHFDTPAPAPDAPAMFRCSEPGLIRGLLKNAGLKNISEQRVSGKINFGPPEAYWLNMMDLAAPVVHAMVKASPEQKKIVRADLFNLLAELSPGDQVELESAALVISGEK